VPAEIFT
jgi:hypothetical protein